MLDEPSNMTPSAPKRGGIGLIVAILFALFVIWMLYTAAQNQSVKVGTNMPGMSQMSQVSPGTAMPQDMPGMNQ